MELVAGENHIQIRAIDTRGNTSDILHIRVTLIQDDAIYTVSKPPTNISLARERDNVVVTCEGVIDPYVVGYNFYASTEQGGGGVGYSRINLTTIRSGESIEDFVTLQDISFLEDVATQESGDPYSDPQYFSILTEQKDLLENVFQRKEKGILQEIPEGTQQLRISYNVSSVRNTTMYSFRHNRLNLKNLLHQRYSIRVCFYQPRRPSFLCCNSGVFFDDIHSIEYECFLSRGCGNTFGRVFGR